MYLLASLVLTLSNLHLIAAHVECCLPSKMEGQRFFVEAQVIKYFVSDYTVNRIYDTFDPDGDVFDIYDLANGRIYHFNGSDCSFDNSLNRKQFSQCILNEGEEELNFVMGKADGGLTTFAKEKTSGEIEQLFVVTASPSVCFLLFVQNKGPVSTETAIFSNVRPSVSNRKIYSNVDNCVEMDRKRR